MKLPLLNRKTLRLEIPLPKPLKNHSRKLSFINFKTVIPQISSSSRQGEDKNNCIDTPGISILLSIMAREWPMALKSKGTEFSTSIYGFGYLFPEQTQWFTLPSIWAQVASRHICCPCDPKTEFVFPLGVQRDSQFKTSKSNGFF